MQIGVDVSGSFAAGAGFEPTVSAAAIGASGTFGEIANWTVDALKRWGLDHKLSELHAKELFADKVREVCQMLGARDDLRLAAVITDSQLLRSPQAVARHREQQRALAEKTRARTEEGRQRRESVLASLENPKLKGAAYALAATLPVLATSALQQALCYFRTDADRADMTIIEMLIDQEPARTVEYTSNTLLPTIGGDPRFSLTVPDQWREPPIHPLLARATHPDGDGLQPQELLSAIEFVDSKTHPCVQVADIAASVVRRRVLDPLNTEDRENFDLLQPLLLGAKGQAFEVFTISPLRPDQVSMYSHLHGPQPQWWLTPVPTPRNA
jgi:Protein of unknown function (DUF3800)